MSDLQCFFVLFFLNWVYFIPAFELIPMSCILHETKKKNSFQNYFCFGIEDLAQIKRSDTESRLIVWPWIITKQHSLVKKKKGMPGNDCFTVGCGNLMFAFSGKKGINLSLEIQSCPSGCFFCKHSWQEVNINYLKRLPCQHIS